MRHRAQQAPEASEPPTDLPAAQETPSILSILRGSTSHFLPCFCSCPRPLPSLPLFNAMPALEAHDPRTLTGSWDGAAALLPTCKTPNTRRKQGEVEEERQRKEPSPGHRQDRSLCASLPRAPLRGAVIRPSGVCDPEPVHETRLKFCSAGEGLLGQSLIPGRGAAPRLLPSPPPCRPKDGRGGSSWGRCPRRAHGARLKGR